MDCEPPPGAVAPRAGVNQGKAWGPFWGLLLEKLGKPDHEWRDVSGRKEGAPGAGVCAECPVALVKCLCAQPGSLPCVAGSFVRLVFILNHPLNKIILLGKE